MVVMEVILSCCREAPYHGKPPLVACSYTSQPTCLQADTAEGLSLGRMRGRTSVIVGSSTTALSIAACCVMNTSTHSSWGFMSSLSELIYGSFIIPTDNARVFSGIKKGLMTPGVFWLDRLLCIYLRLLFSHRNLLNTGDWVWALIGAEWQFVDLRNTKGATRVCKWAAGTVAFASICVDVGVEQYGSCYHCSQQISRHMWRPD